MIEKILDVFVIEQRVVCGSEACDFQLCNTMCHKLP